MLFLTILILLTSLLFFYKITVDPTLNNIENIFKEKKPKKSGFWLGEPIYINNDNWSSSGVPWIQVGAGTEENPHRIENVTINGNRASTCIRIINSSDYFVIKNCTLYNSNYDGTLQDSCGIYLYNTDNGTIINNTITKCGIALYMGWSNDNLFEKNKVFNNYHDGLDIMYSLNNDFINNTILNNTMGINIQRSRFNKFKDNIIYKNRDLGIRLYSDSRNNTIIRNNISSNGNIGVFIWNSNSNSIRFNDIIQNDGIGISLEGSYPVNSDNNSIINNYIYNNTGIGIYIEDGTDNNINDNDIINNQGDGIEISLADNTKLMKNTISLNNGAGVRYWKGWNSFIIGNNITYNIDGIVLGDTGYLLIYNNRFVGNIGDNAFTLNSYCSWDNGSLGNYWDDYDGADANEDGIGDTPYTGINGALAIDHYPIWDDGPGIPIPPFQYILSSNAGCPDSDGEFNLTWSGAYAENFTLLTYTSKITVINNSLSVLANQTATSPYYINVLTNGTYYYILIAYNINGNSTSNCLNVSVQIVSVDDDIDDDKDRKIPFEFIYLAFILTSVTIAKIFINKKRN
ncbi:MAG: nitrous oxide reductase family maturation protein NosD [Candidatus Odinarchaeota archaeon]